MKGLPRAEPKTRARRVSPWVKAWVLFHILAIAVWSLPLPPQTVLDGRARPAGTEWLLLFAARLKGTPFRYYLISTGLWQYWDMFSPNPSDYDVWVDAIVTYSDGSRMRLVYPRMAELSLGEKYLKERYRKFLERVEPNAYDWVWPWFAQRLAYEAWTDPRNPPARVTLRRHWRIVQPPGRPQEPERRFAFFEYVVDPDELRRMAR